MCTVRTARVELRVGFTGRDFRWPLRDTDVVEVWAVGGEMIGVILGETVRHLIQHHMMSVELQRRVSDDLAERTRVYLQTFRKPLAPFSAAQRERLRAKRKARKP